jgi:hypothetical protein
VSRAVALVFVAGTAALAGCGNASPSTAPAEPRPAEEPPAEAPPADPPAVEPAPAEPTAQEPGAPGGDIARQGAEEARRQPVELVVVGRLLRTAGEGPDCGTLHVAIEMEYELLRVEQGSHDGRRILVVHGCPEMTREMYGGPEAGTLTAFRVRDVHRLELVRAPPNGVSIIPFRNGAPGTSYFAVRADPSAP